MRVSVIKVQCGATGNGCSTKPFIWQALTEETPEELRDAIALSVENYPEGLTNALRDAGWRLNYGRWVCSLHTRGVGRV